MRNLIIVLALTFSALQLRAQTQENSHLMFKGVPIDGTLSEYVAKMKLNGFTVVASEPGMSMLQGDFASYKKCNITVVTMKGKDLVSNIKVAFPNQNEWSLLYDSYSNLKELLIQKYGNPSEENSDWLGIGEPSNTFKIYHIQNDECRFSTTFENPNGTISLKIDHKSSICFVSLTYTDKINGEIMKAKAIDDL